MENKELLKKAALQIKALKEKLKHSTMQSDPIAIVSMACRFPGNSNTPKEYWNTLLEGKDPIKEVSPERWSKDSMPEEVSNKFPGTRWAGLLNDIDKFDADFFGIGAVEAKSMDPQQRLLLEISWEAFERSGLTSKELMGSRTGVFIGMVGLDYRYRVEIQPESKLDIYAATGNALCTTSGRISYAFGLEGPSITVETACSSTLVALHQACQSLRTGECNLALVGGTNIILSPISMGLIGSTGALSPDGRCKTFDALANGFVRSEGCGVVLLKRLSDAQQDHDNILAVIRGTAINQDGRSTGLTAPNVLSQQRLLTEALKNANVSASDISYIETHGTGTSLGDPIEIEAIKAVIGTNRGKGNPCILGSVKSNIGHLEAVAGLAGLMKIILMFKNEKIPLQLHFKTLNPRITLDAEQFKIPTEILPWARNTASRIAGLSSFGFSGTNVHVILEEAPLKERKSLIDSHREDLLVFSARTPKAIVDLAKNYAKVMQEKEVLKNLSLSDICYSAALKRTHFEYRGAITGKSHTEICEKLSAFNIKDVTQATLTTKDLVFIFSEQSSSWYPSEKFMQDEDIFRLTLEKFDHYFKNITGFSIINYAKNEKIKTNSVPSYASVALTIINQIAIAELFQSWGITPKIVIGQGFGEIAAAYIAGELNLEQVVKILIYRHTSGQDSNNFPQGDLKKEIFNNLEQELLSTKANDRYKHIELYSVSTAEKNNNSLKYLMETSSYNVSDFKEAITNIDRSGNYDFIDLSLNSPVHQDLERGAEGQIKGHLLKAFEIGKSPRESLLELVGRLYSFGYIIKFEKIMKQGEGWELLPTYPWQHESYWIPESNFQRIETRIFKAKEKETKKEIISKNVNEKIIAGSVKGILIEIVASLLELPDERVRTEHHLFEIGIDSISATRLVNQLQKDYYITVSLADVLREGSINKLATWIDQLSPQVEMDDPNNNEMVIFDEEFDLDFIDEINESDAKKLEEALRTEAR